MVPTKSESKAKELFDQQMIVFLLIHIGIIFMERFTYMTTTKIKKRVKSKQ